MFPRGLIFLHLAEIMNSILKILGFLQVQGKCPREILDMLKINSFQGVREMAQQLEALKSLPEDLGSALRTGTGRLTAACNSSSSELLLFSVLNSRSAHAQ